MALVEFVKTAAGPNFGPYSVGDVADLNAGDVTLHTANDGSGTVPAKVLPANTTKKPNKKGT